MEYLTYGRHLAVDVWGVPYDVLNNKEFLERSMVLAADECGATILLVQSKQFSPEGVTVFLVLSESHFSIHTYPEKGYAAVDCYTCGNTLEPQVAMNTLLAHLKPKEAFAKQFIRGMGEIDITEPQLILHWEGEDHSK
ncbi:MAG TPA: adenosylmethionine decarboxylase [Paenibacillaceae bacterium]|nr:adenosylmethionine decarboxylase [Paenibacillaceae bacterium]